MPQIPRSVPNHSSGSGATLETHRSELVWQHLSRFCAIYGIGWLLALAYVGLIAAALNYSWPRDTFNYTPADRYGDLTRSWTQALVPNPYKSYGKAIEGSYFPPAYAFLRLFRSVSSKTVVLIYMLGSYAGMASMWFWWLRRQRPIWKADSRWGMVAILSLFVVLCSYPMAVAIDRGNIDPLATFLLFWAFELARRGHRLAGSLVMALAASPKGFPFAGVLYWVRRQAVLSILVATCALVALVLLPATLFEGGIRESMRALAVNLSGFRHLYVLGSASAHYSSDWINAVRLLNRWYLHAPIDMSVVVSVHERVIFVCVGLLVLGTVIVIQDTWRELLAIVLIMLVYPNVTNDYKLILLIVPVLEWFSSDARGWRSNLFCVSSALLLVPKHYYFPNVVDHASISCIINPILITMLMAVLWPTSQERVRFAYLIKSSSERALRLMYRPARAVRTTA